MWVHVLGEPAQGAQLPIYMIPTATYGELHLGSSQVPICLKNLSAHAIEVPTKVIVSKIILANEIPPVVLLMRTLQESACCPQKGWILEELNLQGLEKWPEVEQEQARKLLLKWEQLFACSKFLIKHQIELTDQTPFKGVLLAYTSSHVW